MDEKRLEQLKELLVIDKYDLDREITRQPSLYMEVCEEQVMAASRMDAAYDDIKRTAATLDLQIRKELEEQEKKVTEKVVESMVLSHEDYVDARQHYRDCKYENEMLVALKDSLYQRNFMLRDLAAISVAGYYSNNSYNDEAPGQKQVRAKYNKDRMADRRKGVTDKLKAKKKAA